MLKCVSKINDYEDEEWNEDWKEEKERQKGKNWRDKPLHGKFWNESKDVRGERSWDWLKGGHLRKETEALVCAAQEQAFAANSMKARKQMKQ